jgi:hypothetical protein
METSAHILVADDELHRLAAERGTKSAQTQVLGQLASQRARSPTYAITACF